MPLVWTRVRQPDRPGDATKRKKSKRITVAYATELEKLVTDTKNTSVELATYRDRSHATHPPTRTP